MLHFLLNYICHFKSTTLVFHTVCCITVLLFKLLATPQNSDVTAGVLPSGALYKPGWHRVVESQMPLGLISTDGL